MENAASPRAAAAAAAMAAGPKPTVICCIGAGYVGGPTMAMIAHKCPHIKVIVCDLNKARIDAWNSDELPIYEPGLDDIVRAARGRNLFFTCECKPAIAEAEIVFVSVNTPTKTSGVGAGRAADLTYWEGAARDIASVSTSSKIVVEKSTVPVKTASAMAAVLREAAPEGVSFQILSNPEFLAEGTAVTDLLEPDRVLIGGNPCEGGQRAVQALVDIYAHWIPRERILTTNLWSAELSKLTANAFLAQRVSSINAISELAEVSGADVEEISHAIGTDSRIGGKFLKASIGFGGSCFQKDILNLVYICDSFGLKEISDYWYQVIAMNDHQKKRFLHKILDAMFNTVAHKKIAIFGFAFKKDTGDTRETPAVDVVAGLLEDRADIHVYDPQVKRADMLREFEYKFPRNHERFEAVHSSESAAAAAEGASAIAVITEWDEFKALDYEAIYASMKKPAFLFDGRNILDHALLRKIGFHVYAIGKPLQPRLY